MLRTLFLFCAVGIATAIASVSHAATVKIQAVGKVDEVLGYYDLETVNDPLVMPGVEARLTILLDLDSVALTNSGVGPLFAEAYYDVTGKTTLQIGSGPTKETFSFDLVGGFIFNRTDPNISDELSLSSVANPPSGTVFGIGFAFHRLFWDEENLWEPGLEPLDLTALEAAIASPFKSTAGVFNEDENGEVTGVKLANISYDEVTLEVVPLPAGGLLLLSGFAGLVVFNRRSKLVASVDY